MLVLKYVKTGSACFISHIDLLRHVSRILRRAQISVKYSQGFNPHALVFFSPPLGVGVASETEYLAIDTDMSAEDVFEKYNASVPETLKAVKVFECEKNPNLQGRVTCADYVFDTPYRDIDISGGFVIEYQKKGQTVEENVADKIYAVFEENGYLALRLALGNTNLRPDRILPALNAKLGTALGVTDLRKVRQFVNIDGKDVEVDTYLHGKF